MFNVTGYVRSLFRDAALGGIQDAMQVISPEGEVSPDLLAVRERFAAAVQPKQLAAAVKDEPAADEPAKGTKRASR